MDIASIGTLILGGGGLVTGVLALLSAKTNKNKTKSETNLNIANEAHYRENIHQSREALLQKEIILLREEVAALRTLIEKHMSWDWEVVRQLRLAGIEFREPPTLNYAKESKEK